MQPHGMTAWTGAQAGRDVVQDAVAQAEQCGNTFVAEAGVDVAGHR